MGKARKPRSLRDLEESLAEDLLLGPIELADEELREAGLDPVAIGERGAALGRSLTWRTRARKRLDASERTRPRSDDLPDDREALLARIEEARSSTRFGAQVEMAFRDRQPEEADTEELRGLLEDIGMLEQLEDEDLGEEP